MTILGAILTLGGVEIIVPKRLGVLTGRPPEGLARSALIGLVAPAAALAVTAWLTSGFRRPSDPPSRR